MREVRVHRAYYDIITCNVKKMPNILTFYVSMHHTYWVTMLRFDRVNGYHQLTVDVS